MVSVAFVDNMLSKNGISTQIIYLKQEQTHILIKRNSYKALEQYLNIICWKFCIL